MKPARPCVKRDLALNPHHNSGSRATRMSTREPRNGTPSASLLGEPAPGHSSGEAQKALEAIAHKDLPDSAPALGNNAGLASGASITFHVLPPPSAAQGAPKASGIAPGSVNAISSGSPGKPQSDDAGNQKASGTGDIPSGTAPARVTPANNTPAPATQNTPNGATTPH